MGGTTHQPGLPVLQPGDCLLYRPSSFFGWLIAVKTWNWVSHVEVYADNDRSVASRDGIGVNIYPFRNEQLTRILRPRWPFVFAEAMQWFYQEAQGQKYDWKGILVFTLAVRQGARDRMFCSEFSTRFYRAGEFHPFADDYDADRVAPANYLTSPAFDEIWTDQVVQTSAR